MAHRSTPGCKRQTGEGAQRTWGGDSRGAPSLLITRCRSPALCVAVVCSSHCVWGRDREEASNLLAMECGLTAPAHYPHRTPRGPWISLLPPQSWRGHWQDLFLVPSPPSDIKGVGHRSHRGNNDFTLLYKSDDKLGPYPIGQIDLRSNGGTYEGSSHQPTLPPMSHPRHVCPCTQSSTWSSAHILEVGGEGGHGNLPFYALCGLCFSISPDHL